LPAGVNRDSLFDGISTSGFSTSSSSSSCIVPFQSSRDLLQQIRFHFQS
jgi:hypothetical protein